MAVTYGVSRSTNSRIRKVGIGSSEHDLTGDMIIRRTSASVVERKDDHEDVAVSAMTGAGVSAVSALMNDLETRNSPHGTVISPNSVAFGADYVKVVKDTPVLSTAEM